MKKIFAIAVVAMLSVAGFASLSAKTSEPTETNVQSSELHPNVACFHDKYKSDQFNIETLENRVCLVDSHTTVAHYQANAYKSSGQCDPSMEWSTCFSYMFSYDGKTYFFNLD